MTIPIRICEDGLEIFAQPVEEFLDRLYHRSLKDDKAIFTNLYESLQWPRLLAYAAVKVLGNKGAYTAGVDGITKGIFMRTFEHQIDQIRKSLREGYKPLEVLRTYIPKKNGTARPLGICVLRDRTIQEACRLILEAIYEPLFHPYSHGFRIGRSTENCRQDCHTFLAPFKKAQYVLEGDISAFFDYPC